MGLILFPWAKSKGLGAFLMELDPLYGDVIVQRYEAFSGMKAERVGGAALTAAEAR